MSTIDKKEARRLLKAEKKAEKHSLARNLISRRTNVLFNVMLIIFCILIVFPLWIIVVSSITSESALTTYGYRLWPLEFSVNAYTYLFRDGSIMITAYKNTIIATLAGTVLSVITVGLYAYALSRPDFRFKKFFTFFSFFTMLFGGGMVSYYNMTRSVLGLKDTVWALVLPMSVECSGSHHRIRPNRRFRRMAYAASDCLPSCHPRFCNRRFVQRHRCLERFQKLPADQ